MNNKEFDQFIKKSMSSMKDDMPADWSSMEKKLNMKSDSALSAEMEDIYLDGIAYDSLKNFQEPFEPAHWDKMSARLDEEYAYRRKVVITKSMEVLVVLLLLWTGINFIPAKKAIPVPTTPVAEQPKVTVEPQQLISNLSTKNNSDQLTSKITTTTSTSSTEQILADNNISSNSTSTISSNVELASTATNENLISTKEDFTLENEKPIVDNVLSIESRSSSLTNENSNDIKNIDTYNDAILNKSLEEEAKQGILKTTLLAIISPLKSLKPSFLKSTKTKEIDLEKMLALRKARPKGLIVSMFGSSDFNQTVTSYYNDELRANQDFKRYDLGYGGGITLGFQMKKLFVETGLVYHFIKYQQLPITYQGGEFKNGYYEQTWDVAEINLVQIPLHFQYRIYQKNRWNLYGIAGGSLNMAVQNNFAFQETTTSGSRSPREATNESKLSNLALNYNGIFEGGDLSTNSYISANFGFGIERYFSYRWSMFVQPIYRYNFFFDGVGPENDLLNSGSIQIGTKVRLRK